MRRAWVSARRSVALGAAHRQPAVTRDVTRRELLRAAGGLTLLALIPTEREGLVRRWRALSPADEPPLLYTALPYVQPGPAGALENGRESVVIAWQTEDRETDFAVDYGPTTAYGRSATVTVRSRVAGDRSEHDGRRNYAATLSHLDLGRTYRYRVRQGGARGTVIAEGWLTTRKPPGTPIRFVAFGDNAYGEAGERAIAYHAFKARPDFVMNTGDNVYESGLDNEYARYFFPVYNADVAHPRIGAPILRSIPFYTVIANHDVHGKDAASHPVANFESQPDSLAYFTNMHLPLTGPPAPPQAPPAIGPADRVDAFRACAGDRYPRMANYSFDYGDAHFLCLDSNVYVDPTDPGWHDYIADDLGRTTARWKFVVYHHPAFNVGEEHYEEQHMRVLSPIFEAHGVHVVLSGHEHNYQRTLPFRFAPADGSKAALRNEKDRLVPGVFAVDRRFDGRTQTRPKGIIYVTTGAGGKHLYDPGFTDHPESWLHDEDGREAYVATMVSDRHSFTLIELDAHTLELTQIDEWGAPIDRMRIQKV